MTEPIRSGGPRHPLIIRIEREAAITKTDPNPKAG
jgi:hypothetical protein